jgi:hypothetical protein
LSFFLKVGLGFNFENVVVVMPYFLVPVLNPNTSSIISAVTSSSTSNYGSAGMIARLTLVLIFPTEL